MQPPNLTLSNLYSYRPPQPTSQLHSHFPPQNPNPNPNYPPIHYEPHYTRAPIDPNPPDVDSSSSSYPFNHAGGVYSDNHAATLTYSHAVSAAPPSTYATDAVVYDWAAKEPVLHYVYLNTIYTTAATVPQDPSQQLSPALPHISWTDLNPNAQPHVAWKKIPKKIKIAQSAWCEVCKLACNSTEVLSTHKLGKKHLKSLAKLTKAAYVATTSTTTNINLAVPSNTIVGPVATTSATANVNSAVPNTTIIGPVENPKKSKLGRKNKAETPQDLAKKKRKVLEGGAAANLVRTCQICNVVCNSDTVYRFHIAGQKHASMLKKLQQAAVV